MRTKVSFHVRNTLRAIVLLPALLSAAVGASAQSTSTASRITAAVDNTQLVTLHGSRSASADTRYDQGSASSSQTMTHIHLLLSRSTTQEKSLTTYLAELQQKSSPNFHKWLTPTQFGQLYGPSDADIAAITNWLQSQGLTVTSTPKGRTSIDFSGSVSLVENAFHTSIHSYSHNGETWLANTTDPQIPTALAPVVTGVAHLSTRRPKPQLIRGTNGHYNSTKHRMEKASSALHANLTYDDSGTDYLYVVPADAATIYNTPNAYNANFSSSSSSTYNGSGITIGIGGDSAINTQYVVNYRTLFLSGNTTAPTVTNVDGVASNSDADEAYLDTEISGGLAPGATIHYYASSDLTSAIEQAVDDNTVDIFSLSFGECEQDMATTDNEWINETWEQFAAQGITVTVSTGDTGSAGCDSNTDSNGNEVTSATGGLSVNGFASTPYNIAVGGTDFDALANSFSTYAGSTNSSTTYYRTALSYIPEATWNDSVQTNGAMSTNIPYTGSYASIAAAGGGPSNCSTNTTTYTTSGNVTLGTCTSGYSKPSWQTGTYDDNVRDTPDISLFAADGAYYAAWLFCGNDTEQGTYVDSCTVESGSYSFGGVGGTSTSTPAFAGILALVAQKSGGRLGQANSELYSLFNGTSASSIFHDIGASSTSNIAVPCTESTSNSSSCIKNSEGYYFENGYNTKTGYDYATGMGSVDATELITNWSNPTGTLATTVTVTPTSSTIAQTASLSVTIAVVGASGTGVPSGTVTLSGGGYTSSALTITGSGCTPADGSTSACTGTATVTTTIPASSLTVGTDTLTATYSGDVNFAASTGKSTVTVTGTSSGGTTTATTTTLTASSQSISVGSTLTLTATVSPSAATGTVTFTASGTTLGTGTLSSGTASFSTSSLTAGTYSITATYGGDTTYAASTSSAVSVVVEPASFTLTVSPSTLTISQGSTGSETVTVTPVDGYTGTVDWTASVADTTGTWASYGALCISPVTVSGTTAVSTTLVAYTSAHTCTTTARIETDKALPVQHLPGSSRTTALSASLAGLLAIGLLGLRVRRLRLMAILLTAAAFGGLLSGCGGSNSISSTGTSSYVTKGSYTVTLTGKDSSDSTITASKTFTITVD